MIVISVPSTSLVHAHLRVHPQVRLEAEGVDGGDEGLDGVEGGARDGRVLRHVASALRQHRVHGGDAVGGRLEGREEGWKAW